MLLAYNGIIPPKEWYHNRFLFSSDDKTVKSLLHKNNINIPKEWDYNNYIPRNLIYYCEHFNNDL